MFHRLMVRRRLTLLKGLGALAGFVVVTGTTLTLALQVAADARYWKVSDAGKKRAVRVVSPDRIGKATAPALSVPIGTVAAVEPATVVENSVTTGFSSEDAAPLAHSSAPAPRAVSPRTRAEVPARFRNTLPKPQSTGLGLSRQEKSYTGAGRAFDAVH